MKVGQMTAPAPSPELQEPPPVDKSGPSRRTIIGWSVVMLLLLGLSLFIGLVVVPIWHTRSVVQEYASSRQSLSLIHISEPTRPY